MLQARLLVITAHRCFVRFLVHQFAVNLHSQVCQVCFRAFEQELRVKRVSLQDRVTQFHNDGTWLNNGPRTQYPALHSRVRLRGDPSNVFGNKRPQPADFPQHGTALHLIRPDCRPVHALNVHIYCYLLERNSPAPGSLC